MRASKSDKKRYLAIDHKVIKLPSDIGNGQHTEFHLTNITHENIAFKFRMRDPSMCSVRPPKGFIPPSSQQEIKIHILPTPEPVDKIIIDTVPIVNTSDLDGVWKERKDDIVKQAIAFRYGGEESTPSEPHSECPSGFNSVIQTPVAPGPKPADVTVTPVDSTNTSTLGERIDMAESDMMSSALDHSGEIEEQKIEEKPQKQEEEEQKPQKQEEEQKPEEQKPQEQQVILDSCSSAEYKELKEKYDKLIAERNDLQSRITALQGQNARLQADFEAQQKKLDVGTEESRAERNSWMMFIASIIALLSVIIYSFTRPSSKSEL